MPLTRRQFELGIDDEIEALMRQIYDLLAGHRELAYSTEELREMVLGDSSGMTEGERFNRALTVLAEIGAVDKGEVRNKDHYAFHQEVETKSWEPKARRSVVRVQKLRKGRSA